MLLSNHEAFAKDEKGKKWDFRSMEELACDLIHVKDENCKYLKALHRSIPRVLFWSAKHFMVGLLDYSYLFVIGLDEIRIKDELVVCMQQ